MSSIMALVLVFSGFGTIGSRVAPRFHQDVVIENDVLIGGQMPYKGVLCEDTGVYGDPYGLAEAHYFLEAGNVVPLHELAPDGSGWVMIHKAEWIPLETVCKW